MDRAILAKYVFFGLLSAVLLALLLAALTAPPVFSTGLTGCTEVVINGGFENQGQGWLLQASPALPAGESLINSYYPHSGARGADLAGRDGANDRLSQQVTLPANTASLSLSFWWALITQETASSTAFDYLRIALYSVDGSTLVAPLLTLHNASAADSWVWDFPTIDLGDYGGQTLVLRFTATNDAAGNPTEFFVDDISIQACAAVPVTTATSTPTATATPTVKATATATATAAASVTPTPTQGTPQARRPGFLPLLLHGKR